MFQHIYQCGQKPTTQEKLFKKKQNANMLVIFYHTKPKLTDFNVTDNDGNANFRSPIRMHYIRII